MIHCPEKNGSSPTGIMKWNGIVYILISCGTTLWWHAENSGFFETPSGVKIAVICYNGPQWGHFFTRENGKTKIIEFKIMAWNNFLRSLKAEKLKSKNLATRNISILHVNGIVPCTVAPPCVKTLVEISTRVHSS